MKTTTPMFPVIGFAGYARSGKDTCADRLVACHGFTKSDYGTQVMNLLLQVDPWVIMPLGYRGPQGARLSVFYDRMGYEDTKNVTSVRTLMQNLGTALNDQDPDFLTRMVLADTSRPLAVSGLRTNANANAVRARNGLVVWVDRPGTGPVNGHRNETGLRAEDCDVTIVNDGSIDDLLAKVDSIGSMLSVAA